MAKAKKRLSDKATYVTYGYGQVEGNKLSARYNGKIFASLPCEKNLEVVENGMFLCYNYAKRMVTKPEAEGLEPMLVFNEVKVYENRETDADFAMLAENYSASVYNTTADGRYAHYVPGTDANITIDHDQKKVKPAEETSRILTEYDNITSMQNGSDELQPYGMMNASTRATGLEVNSIVPRLFKTDVGDIMTTNCVVAAPGSLKVGTVLKVDADGYLNTSGVYDGMEWTVVNVYTMPDLQPGVKIMRTK